MFDNFSVTMLVNRVLLKYKISKIIFIKGQIGFGVILILFFYYFSIILLLGAEINAFFFENIPPLEQPIGTFLSETSQEASHQNIEETLHNKNDQQQISTKNNNQQENRFISLFNKCCSCHKPNSVKPNENDMNNA